MNKVDIKGRCIEWYTFYKNSLRARYIRNALVGMAYSSWPIFALHSNFPCIFVAIVAGICSWCALVGDSERCWLWPGIMIPRWCGNLEGKRFNTLYGRYVGSFYILKLHVHTHCMHICWWNNLGFKNPTETMISHNEAFVYVKCAEHGWLYECIFDF